MQRLDNLGIPVDALPDLLNTTESAIKRWVAGVLPVEEADIVEVGLSMLEVRIARSVARQYEMTVQIAAVA